MDQSERSQSGSASEHSGARRQTFSLVCKLLTLHLADTGRKHIAHCMATGTERQNKSKECNAEQARIRHLFPGV